MSAALQQLRAARVLDALDVHLAHGLGRMAGEEDERVLVALALASRRVTEGHVCLDLRAWASGDAAPGSAMPRWPALEPWLDALRASRLVDTPGDGARPLVLDASGRLYLRRYWEHQEGLANALRARLSPVEMTYDARDARAMLDRLFAGGAGGGLTDGEPDLQRVAATVALTRRFCVISGGPGTGKTSTVVKILAALMEPAIRRGEAPPHALLLAPTGKAAARLVESIKRSKQQLPCETAVRDAIPEEASTIHRALAPIAGSSTRFRRHAGDPLPADIVLVDEASMVDLALMARLVDAVPPGARLILLGDQNQLASVEAGAVLGDICGPHGQRGYSAEAARRIAELGGGDVEPAHDAPPAIADAVVRLERSYRYAAESGIGRLASALHAASIDPDAACDQALDVLSSNAHPDVSLVAPTVQGLGDVLREEALRGYRGYLEQRDPAAMLAALDGFRVLCAHRRGPFGVEATNAQIERALHRAGLLHTEGTWYAGRPILITQNSYAQRLFNGDVGLLWPQDGQLRAHFVAADGAHRSLAPGWLPAHETVFAMSIHKSQGSEMNEVAVRLPDPRSPLLSRELLYTAVTRAKHRVSLHATPQAVRDAIRHPVRRASGLRELLWDDAG